MYKIACRLLNVSVLLLAVSHCTAQDAVISSPDKKITVVVERSGSATGYRVLREGAEVIHFSKLGLHSMEADLVTGLVYKSAGPSTLTKGNYRLYTGKQRSVNYVANRRTIVFNAGNTHQLEVEFHVANDGLAFRYKVHGKGVTGVTGEATSFALDTSARAFLQPMQVAKTGFEQTNPAYEDNYLQDLPAGAASPSAAGWVYPALFRSGSHWLLFTEAGMDGTYCATHLMNDSARSEYQVVFPDPREVIGSGGLLPLKGRTITTPWRVITIGSLSAILSSTLGTDVAAPAARYDWSFVKPGIASWSWIMSKDDSIVYSEQKRYVDFAADMNWKYCLVDANWDTMIGYEKMALLSDYAASRKVGLLLWYNSAGNWNTVKMTPKDKLLTHESRTAEFSRLNKMGVKGIKVDFFGGDGQSVMAYYIGILEDAAKAKLMVNFHGATLPRGWSRTYPHLVTTEAVKGFEMVTFNQRDADREANHSTMLPFTRNVFDPMDFTSMNLYKIGSPVIRKTSSAFELATSVIFLSGIQHVAESPAGMSHVPAEVVAFLRHLPVQWDEVKFIDGYPGKSVVLARRAGGTWYIAGMNGEPVTKTVNLDLSLFKGSKATLYTDGDTDLTFRVDQVTAAGSTTVTMKPEGGFVLVVEQGPIRPVK